MLRHKDGYNFHIRVEAASWTDVTLVRCKVGVLVIRQGCNHTATSSAMKANTSTPSLHGHRLELPKRRQKHINIQMK